MHLITEVRCIYIEIIFLSAHVFMMHISHVKILTLILIYDTCIN